MKKLAVALVIVLVVALCGCSNKPGAFVIWSLDDLSGKKADGIETEKIVNGISGFVKVEAEIADGDYIWNGIEAKYYKADIDTIRLHETESGEREIVLSSPPTSGKTTEDMFAYIDEFIEWVKGVNEKTKTTGTAFIDGDEWEGALDKAVWDYEVRAKEAYYLTMCLAAIAGECQLTYDWGRHSAEAHLTTDTYTTEYTFHIDQ